MNRREFGAAVGACVSLPSTAEQPRCELALSENSVRGSGSICVFFGELSTGTIPVLPGDTEETIGQKICDALGMATGPVVAISEHGILEFHDDWEGDAVMRQRDTAPK